ncbi:SGNH/GDSL hydrolase family protein [Streptomyces sp. NPDC002870]|uniref:SGNH/GDSL hydrolase family protein n=1 Tax=Streptomyces sp. NPDC002870 TaxID=3364666 RepID=UPI00367FEF5E
MTRFSRRTTLARRTAMTAALAAASASLVSAGAGSALGAGGSGQNSVSRYVALGDSYASGAGLAQRTDAACQKSSLGYPSLLAKAYKSAKFKNVTCSGATTRSLWNKQGTAAPQLNALTKDTDLITVSLGGNDLRFADVLRQCVIAGLADRQGSPCRDQLNAGGADQLAQRMAKLAPRIGSMLVDIDRRSPNARVVVVGYPALFPSKGDSCGSSVPLAKGDVTYLDSTTKKLNAMLAQQARKGGAVYVDTYTVSTGQDMCQPEGTRWTNPLLPVTEGSAHPNFLGHLFMGNRVFEALKKA